MKLTRLLKIFPKKKNVRTTEGFSDFFRTASNEEKTRILTEAAHKANKDQREVFDRTNLKLKTQ